MKTKEMKGFGLSLVFAVLAASTLSAQFVRLEVDLVAEHTEGVLAGQKTFRVYAVFENQGDIIDAVYGEKSAPLEVKTTTKFYQHERGGSLTTEIQRYDITVAPELAYDSWVTIGLEDNYLNALSGFIMDFGTFDEGGSIVTNNGAWFVTPDKRQALAGASKRILLMQLTSDGYITGVINIHGRTKAIYDESGEQIGGGDEIKSEGLVFEAK